ncbi:MAG: hypothetical protein M3O36_07605 [Myxococcota bacterium]|nr:hypothetical protein [Myxococcota bacterium]
MTPPGRDQTYLVFAQRLDARVEIDAWNAHAVRFFATRIGLTAEKRYEAGAPFPRTDAAEFVVAPDGELAGRRTAFARPSDDEDRARAEALDARGGFTGLGLLARRCGTVWLVTRVGQPDALALRLAAILASVLLGPILDEMAGDLFGVKTARAKLEGLSRVG